MDQTYYQTAMMLPASKKESMLPRPQGDGMDSETLKIRELTPTRDLPKHIRRHQNLASSPKTTSVSKNEGPHFIPHEPVKGAVKPLSQVVQQDLAAKTGNIQPTNLKSTTRYPNGSDRLDSKLNITATKHDYTTSFGCEQYYRHQQYEKPSDMTTVRTISVPVYNAPAHLSHGTYKTIERQQQQQQQQQQQLAPQAFTANSSQLAQNSDSVKISMVENDLVKSERVAENLDNSVNHVALTMEEVLEVAREVEGDARVASMADLEKLNDEIDELRRELEHQSKVNTDLKKLLVASMGEDLHYRVDRLVQDKQQLAAEVGCYTKKMYQDYEDIDKLSIQADLWRSKFKASRVMTDQLTQQNSQLTQKHQSAHQALQRLLNERQQIKEWLSQTHRFLYHVKTAFEPKHTVRPSRTGPQTLLSLSQTNLQLADSIKFRLLGPVLSTEGCVGAGTVDALSPAEAYAFQVLSTPMPASLNADTSGQPPAIPYTVSESHARFHPAVKHDNLTFNICNHCKGEIQLV